MSDILIYGKLKNFTSDGILAGTDQVKDEEQGKFQSQINKELYEKSGNSSTHASNKSNPHNVTKSQVGLGNVTNDAQVKRSEMGKPNGVATLDDGGKVPSSQLPSYVDDVIDCYATYVTSPTGVISDIKLFSDPGKKDPIVPEEGKIYIEKEHNLQFRWTGTTYAFMGSPTVIGEITGTAYDGKKGKDTTDKVNNHTLNKSNPHEVTKAQVGLGNVNNTSDLDKPVSTATQNALDLKVNKSFTISGHKLDGSGLDLIKSDVGLGNVDNTSDLNKPISTDQQEALNLKADKTTTINGHKLSEGDFNILKSEIGLGNVDNTSDLNKPISTATQNALDKLKESMESGSGSTSQEISGIKDRLTKVETNKVDNTITVNGQPLSKNVTLTKSDVELGNVNNTSDLDKPISTATQGALDLKVNKTTTVNGHKLDSGSVTVTKSDVGLGNVTNDAQVKRSEMGKPNGVATLDNEGKVPSSQLPSYVDDVIECYATYTESASGALSEIKLFSDPSKKVAIVPESGKIYIEKEHNHQFRWTGTNYAVIGTPTVIGEVTGTAYDGKKGKDTTDKVNNHVLNKSNPHEVTKAQVGLGNVDNTSDLNKPISTATQNALDSMNQNINKNTESCTNISNRISNVDNTSDLNKPISTAAQEEFDKLYKVMYNQHSSTSIWSNVSGNIIEKGISKAVTINWSYNFNGKSENPETLVLTSGGTTLESSVSKKSYTESISNTKSYTITSTNKGITKSSGITINAYYPKYFGGSSKTSLTSSDILALNKQAIKSNASGEYSFTVEKDQYAWFCVPSDMKIKKITSGGFGVPIEPLITSAVDGKGTYNCYRSSEKFKAGTFNCKIEI